LSLFRTSNLGKSSKIAVAVAILGVVAGGAGGLSVVSAERAARPPAITQQAHPGTQVAPASDARAGAQSRGSGHQAATLDVYSAIATPLAARQIARSMLPLFHWRLWQFRFLNYLWSRESSWNVRATNPYSGAYGIPQAVPGSKMASAGPYWRTSARTQIRWGLRYIKSRYGSPHAAWEHELRTGWY